MPSENNNIPNYFLNLLSKNSNASIPLRMFFNHVKRKHLQGEGAATEAIREALINGYQLIEKNYCNEAFELLCEEFVNNGFVLNDIGRQWVMEALKLGGPEQDWQFDFRKIIAPEYKKGSWKLADSEEWAKKNKYTFYKPSKMITNQLKVKDAVMLQFDFKSIRSGYERMWVEITDIDNKKFIGKLGNMPLHIHELNPGDTIKFDHKHIIGHNLNVTEPNLIDKYSLECYVSNQVFKEGARIDLLFREESEDVEISGWAFLSGNEPEGYFKDENNVTFMKLGDVLAKDDSFIELLDSKIGSRFGRNKLGKFEIIEE
jgi:hypothetical protein